jgi:hypothetical protein
MPGAVNARQAKTHLQWENVHVEIRLHDCLYCCPQHRCFRRGRHAARHSRQFFHGDRLDVLVDKSGKVTSFIVGVGGFLGAGEKDVSVPFDAVRITTKDNNKWYLVMNTTKDELKSASGFTYDKNATTWVPDKK